MTVVLLNKTNLKFVLFIILKKIVVVLDLY